MQGVGNNICRKRNVIYQNIHETQLEVCIYNLVSNPVDKKFICYLANTNMYAKVVCSVWLLLLLLLEERKGTLDPSLTSENPSKLFKFTRREKMSTRHLQTKRDLHINIYAIHCCIFSYKALNSIPFWTICTMLIINPGHVYWSCQNFRRRERYIRHTNCLSTNNLQIWISILSFFFFWQVHLSYQFNRITTTS